MDVLLISRCPPFPLYYGDRLIPYHLARELSARRYLIDLLAFYDSPEDIAEIPRYERLFRSVKLIGEPRRSIMSYWRRVRKRSARFPVDGADSWSPNMWKSIEQAIPNQPYDVAHVFGGVQVYEYLHLVRRIPNIIVPYESYSLWLERAVQEERSRTERWIQRFQHRVASSFESWMFEGYDRVVVLTDHDARALKALNAQIPIVTIPNGVDLDHFTPTGFEPDEPVLLFTGNYNYAPNLDAALRLVRDIFPKIKQAVPRSRLYLVGGNPPPELQVYASPDVEITGRVPDLRPYFEYSLVYVSPLRLGAGIKNKVLEAMAMQVPVVATPLSCDGIPVVHGQHVMLGTSDEELIYAVFQLFREPRLRVQLRRNGRQLIEQNFTWQHVADQYEDLYQQVIREHRERAQVGLT
ncbi:MAG TPA: glycosyltransferase [Aggregatilineaceae bacterium]|nr:glycosyltransferase [Aggregatilineaceae bacterium]